MPEAHTVEAYKDRRQPHTHRPQCPACNSPRYGVRYRETKGVRGPDGQSIIDASSFGEHDPHLVVQCGECGFWWEMEVATP